LGAVGTAKEQEKLTSAREKMLREYGHSLLIADGHLKILFVFMHGSHHAWNTV